MSPLACPPAAPSGAVRRVIESAELSDSAMRQLAADHKAAIRAAEAPDVLAELTDAAHETAGRLGLDPHDPHTLAALLQLAVRCYRHGHVDCAEQAATPIPVLMLAGRT